MAEAARRISRLSPGLRANIQSAVQITSANDVVLELVKNALDAQARNIEIRLDFIKGYCSVVDDGHGIPQEEFWEEGGLARMYHTSRDHDALAYHGRYGRFLASLSEVSLLTIASIHASSQCAASLVIRNGKRIAAQTNQPRDHFGLGTCGTRIVVHDLFGQIPVRVKHRLARFENRRELNKEFQVLKKALVALVLASERNFSIELKEAGCKKVYTHKSLAATGNNTKFRIDRIVSVLSHAGFFPPDTNSWRVVSGNSSELAVCAAICTDPASSKDAQFISIGHRPIDNQLLLKEVNDVFEASSFGDLGSWMVGNRTNPRDQSDDEGGHITRHPVVTGKAIEKWPMFYICIDVKHDVALTLNTKHNTEMEEWLGRISSMLRMLATEFLRSHGLHVSTSRRTHRHRSIRIPRKSDGDPCTRGESHGFDAWSRIKSAIALQPSGFLAGLPFATGHVQQEAVGAAQLVDTLELAGASTTAASRFLAHESKSDNVVRWSDARTGRQLLLNSRTGMVEFCRKEKMNAEDASRVPSSIQRIIATSRVELRDVVQRLIKERYLPTAPETPVASIAANASLSSESHHTLHDCTISEALGIKPVTDHTSSHWLMQSVTKAGLLSARVLGQIDEKFVLVMIPKPQCSATCAKDYLLVLIDQHAADERVKVEELYYRICGGDAVVLATPAVFAIESTEVDLFRDLIDYFSAWDIQLEVINVEQSEAAVRVTALPELIAQRCSLEPKLLVDLLRQEVWSTDDRHAHVSSKLQEPRHWFTTITDCPPGILAMLRSRACRSAIMFNDKLSLKQCQTLVSRLGECFFPFQCAHGRPSMTVLAKLQDLDNADDDPCIDVPTFGQGWTAWADNS